MALPSANFPDSVWDGNEQDVTNDPAAQDDTVGEAGDYNEIAAEVVALQNRSRAKKATRCYNDSGGALAAGTLVAISGTDPARDATSGLAKIEAADRDYYDLPAAGILEAEIADGAAGDVMTEGVYGPLDTSSYNVGDILWLGASGALAATPPDGTNDGIQPVGKVLVSHASDGYIYINPAPRFIQRQRAHVRWGALPGSDDRYALVMSSRTYALRLVVVSDTGTAGSGAGDRYDIQVANLTDTQDLLASAFTTNGNEIAANVPEIIPFDQNRGLAGVRVLEIQVTKTGAPTDLSGAEVSMFVEFVELTQGA